MSGEPRRAGHVHPQLRPMALEQRRAHLLGRPRPRTRAAATSSPGAAPPARTPAPATRARPRARAPPRAGAGAAGRDEQGVHQTRAGGGAGGHEPGQQRAHRGAHVRHTARRQVREERLLGQQRGLGLGEEREQPHAQRPERRVLRLQRARASNSSGTDSARKSRRRSSSPPSSCTSAQRVGEQVAHHAQSPPSATRAPARRAPRASRPPMSGASSRVRSASSAATSRPTSACDHRLGEHGAAHQRVGSRRGCPRGARWPAPARKAASSTRR